MTRRATATRCEACGSTDALAASTSRVVVDGRTIALCRRHAAMIASELPRSFEELRAVFRGMESPLHGDHQPPAGEERRSPVSRRDVLDRREFPPRPEGRRASSGRRKSDRVA